MRLSNFLLRFSVSDVADFNTSNDLFSKSAGAAPDLNTSFKDPYFSVNFSTSYPLSFRVVFNFSSKTLVSIPASLILFINLSQLEVNAPSNREFLESADSDIILPNKSDNSVNNDLASSKSPTKSSQV